MFFLGRWISRGSLWFTSRLARIFSLPGWLWLLLGFQGEKRTAVKDVENDEPILSVQSQDAASVGIVGHGVVETTNGVIPNGELVSDGELRNVNGKYMPIGNLSKYILAHNDEISTIQRLQWVLEAPEALQLLHSADIMHCDVEPKNFLVDEHLSLRISDFSGSSIKGSKPLAHAGARFSHPSYEWRYVPTIQDDLFALGSTIFVIITGLLPFQEIDSYEVIKRYEADERADVTGILCGEIIERCWRNEIASAQEIYDAVQEKIKTSKIDIPL